jgi:hypothetical protein
MYLAAMATGFLRFIRHSVSMQFPNNYTLKGAARSPFDELEE